ncbi:peroxisome proliferator-activated receptor gamma coactivator 1-beta isoform X1 [Synchiropus splendidus]|uniref:peroxisome proliferator-activated receptor gamma coactivator 1-beta isoform X1 n=1 Tax=Synchiropus splendidus TaxID=270530 RepID=UPI00237D4761|nr:peroxisome proliferator-activated receptor gamma coactivator 1-beta isoform X1 [Synchiropus splendidus]
MAACAPLLDEELSSFVFNYLTENSGSQYGEEEVCSDRLDFPDIDLSQLDPSDFDSDNCLSELQWCNDQSTGTSPTSIHYSTTDELFEIEEEHAALLAALTLDGMVDGEVGGLSVFPALEEEPKDEEEAGLALSPEDLSHSLGAHTEDLSLLRQLLLTPPNVPTGSDGHKDGFRTHRYNNRGSHLRPVRPLVKSDPPLERKPRAVRPAGRLCTELHRHLTTARDSEDTRTPETEEDEEEEEDEDSESEEDEEEEEESSSSEVEAAAAPVEPPKPQFSSEKELHSVVELITYMHTYCLPMRKQQGWERKDREIQRHRARPETSRPTSSNTRVVLVGGPSTSSGTTSAPRRLPFARRREQKADSLLCELLQQSSSYDVSKPYRLHSPPYSHPHSPSRLTPSATKSTTTLSPSSPKPELHKDSCSPKRRADSPEVFLEMPEDGGSFSVRRSRRLASFPSRFAKRLRPSRQRELELKLREEGDERHLGVKVFPTQAGGGTTTETLVEKLTSEESAMEKSCGHNEKRSCLCLPLNPKTTSESQFSSKGFEQTLGVDLCGTAGLTPPTTPPHKSVEDELFKPAEGGKSGGGSGGGGGDSILSSPNAASRSWLSRVQHQRKLPEQTELYAQLRRMGQAGDGETRRSFGDHDYCALSLGESRKRSAAILGAILKAQGGRERAGTPEPKPAVDQVLVEETCEENADPLVAPDVTELEEEQTVIDEMLTDFQMLESTPPTSEEEAERSSGSRSPSPVHLCPDSPASKTDCSEHSEICSDDKPSNKDMLDEDDCQLLYIHNLPSSMTQNMLKKRFQVFGKAEDCKVIFCNDRERCGVIKIRQSELQRHWRDRDIFPASQRRLSRKRYIDLDEAGPGPVKSKYDALDFDTLLKEAQKSLHR